MKMPADIRRVFVPMLLAVLTLPLQAAAKPAASRPAAPATGAARGTAARFSNAYASPKSSLRPARKKTQFIILHTTEGARVGALEKLRDNGECHYVVDKSGVVYRIVDRKKVAFHCGRSMWNNVRDLDQLSIGIEIVGEHDHELTNAQYDALKYLLGELKRIYKVPDERILTHSMVAYGTPNRWQKRSHRGRKRCGMLLADPARRRRMGVLAKPAYDPDLRAGRLADADPELTRILYGGTSQTPPRQAPSGANRPTQTPPPPTSPPPAPSAPANVIGPRRSAWDIARDQYNAATTLYTFPDGSTKKGSEIRNWKTIPAGTVVRVAEDDENAPDTAEVLGRDGSSVREIAGDEARASSTFYFPPNSKTFHRGASLDDAAIDKLPAGTRVLVGYAVGGPVSPRKKIFDICGVRWNRPETYYLTPKGTLLQGNAINERTIPAGTWVFYRQ